MFSPSEVFTELDEGENLMSAGLGNLDCLGMFWHVYPLQHILLSAIGKMYAPFAHRPMATLLPLLLPVSVLRTLRISAPPFTHLSLIAQQYKWATITQYKTIWELPI